MVDLLPLLELGNLLFILKDGIKYLELVAEILLCAASIIFLFISILLVKMNMPVEQFKMMKAKSITVLIPLMKPNIQVMPNSILKVRQLDIQDLSLCVLFMFFSLTTL